MLGTILIIVLIIALLGGSWLFWQMGSAPYLGGGLGLVLVIVIILVVLGRI